MTKIFSRYIIGGLATLFLFVTSQNIFAAELNFKVISDGVADSKDAVVEVRIDPHSKKINVVEGSLVFSGSATKDLSVQIENGNSVLPLWPTAPQYVSAEKIIRFIGGVPDGIDSEGLLFLMRLTSSTGGDIHVSYVDGAAYLNDGKGTREDVLSNPLHISVSQSGDANVDKEKLSVNKKGILVLVAIVFICFLSYVYKKFTKK